MREWNIKSMRLLVEKDTAIIMPTCLKISKGDLLFLSC